MTKDEFQTLLDRIILEKVVETEGDSGSTDATESTDNGYNGVNGYNT